MRRHALLIGYSGKNSTDGYLRGVSNDLLNMKNFLLSERGGAWNNSEICLFYDKQKTDIERHVSIIKNRYDMLFIYYSGHGCYDSTQKCRVLAFPNNNLIYETALWNLAPRQILICDSCSGIERSILVENAMDRNAALSSTSSQRIRQYYNQKCMQCHQQQIKLYASAPGTAAEDLGNGGRYTSTLLDVLNDKNLTTTLNMRQAHNKATDLVIQESQGSQHPDFSIPRHRDDQILPAAIILPRN